MITKGRHSLDLSCLVGKPTMWFPNRSDTNRAVQAQKQARSLKFQIYEEDEVYYPCSENKGTDQLRGVTAKLICTFVFSYADCWFSHQAAHLLTASLFQNAIYPLPLIEKRHVNIIKFHFLALLQALIIEKHSCYACS